MSDTKISALTDGTTAEGTDRIPVSRGGANRYITPAYVATYLGFTTGVLAVASGGTGISSFGTGVATALGVNVGSAGAFVTFNGALGTPSSGTATNLTGTAAGLTAGTASAVAVGGITGLGTGVATALAINVGSAGAPVVLNGALGTPSSGTLTNATGLPVSSGISGMGTNVATALAVNVGTDGAFVVKGGALGTPSSGVATNLTGLPASAIVSGTLAEDVGIALDAALSADGKYCGITEAGTAGATLAFGEVVYLQTSDSRWELARANAASTSANKLGICVLAAAADGDPTLILLFGKVRADTKFPALTVGAPVYISAATAGIITSTAPSGTTDFVVRKIGFGNTADELFFQPSNDYITLA